MHVVASFGFVFLHIDAMKCLECCAYDVCYQVL